MKAHVMRELVNDLRDLAIRFHCFDSLRERIARRVQQDVSLDVDAVHVKTGNVYSIIGAAVNATNAQDGQTMVIYERDGKMYVREATEFMEKFNAGNRIADAQST